ncbi:MAG: XisI protein [Armatimonadetes bacterium]|nr:XisI protein [Armatimonadota bacterium]
MVPNDKLTTDGEIAFTVLREIREMYANAEPAFRVLSISDDATGNFLLMDEGWDKYKRVLRVWLHIELRDDLFWIQEDGTEIGVANLLLSAGIPASRIVLAFNHPSLRQHTDFAAP